jgi:hypothetical protein
MGRFNMLAPAGWPWLLWLAVVMAVGDMKMCFGLLIRPSQNA